jgi:23S rRNA (adenine2503-C2)-methyltransferase
LHQQWRVSEFQKVEAFPSRDGSIKYLYTMLDGVPTEAVLMPYPGRMTICLSSQAGCPAGCTFCATGRMGLLRNLTTPEILDQLLAAAQERRVPPAAVRNVVLMGMGEPLLNLEGVLPAVRRLVDREAFGLSPRRITLSTVGIPRGIRRLTDEDLGVRLALSLHAPDDDTRRRIIPTANRFAIAEIMEEVHRYQALRKRRITFEYTLIEGVNDHLWQADQLAILMAGLAAHVNLIPWNRWAGAPVNGTSEEGIRNFEARLRQRRVRVSVRWSRGRDVGAACGQLAYRPPHEAKPIPRSIDISAPGE